MKTNSVKMGSNDFQLSYCIRKAFAKLRQLTIMNRVKVPGNTFEAFYLKTLFELFFLLNIIQWPLVRLFRNVVFILFTLHDELLINHCSPKDGPWTIGGPPKSFLWSMIFFAPTSEYSYLLNKYDQKWSHV